MSKSPIRDYTRLIDNIRTTKKDTQFSYSPNKFSLQTLHGEKMMNQIRMKLDLALKHNTRLLDQNSMLSEMVNKLRFELKYSNDQIEILEKNASTRDIAGSQDRERLIGQVAIKQKIHEGQLEKLLRQISDLHSTKNEMEICKGKQVEELRDSYERSTLTHIQNMKSCQNNSKEIYERQISNLKQVSERLEHEKDNAEATNKIQGNRFKDTIKSLEAELRHLKHVQDLDRKQLKNKFDHELNSEKRSMQHERELQATSHQMKMKRLRNEITEKNHELDVLTRRMVQGDEASQVEHLNLKSQKENLLSEMAGVQLEKNNAICREKAKLNQLNRLQVENLVSMSETHTEMLGSEISRLMELIEIKTEEIKRLYEENQNTKISYNTEKELLRGENDELRIRIRRLEGENLEDLQLFKIKMARLFQSDIEAISSYYNHEIENLQIHVDQLTKSSAASREKLFQSILENDQIRKEFEIEISKQKAKLQDLKVRIAAMDVEHREQVSNLGTKMQMTSQNLFREAEQKIISSQFFDQEKKKFHSIAGNKDQEIADLLDNIQLLKAMHGSELDVIRTEKGDLRLHVQELEGDKARLKENFQKDIERKEQKLREISFSTEKQVDEIRQLGKKNEEVEKENIKLQKLVEQHMRENRAILQELGLSKGFLETYQLESSAAIQQQKNKVRVIMNKNQISLKVYYEDKVESKDKDIKTLQRLLAERQQDVRELIMKYNAMEKRLELLMETQTKLIDFQEKVKGIGMDNNLVKNLAEMFRRYD